MRTDTDATRYFANVRTFAPLPPPKSTAPKEPDAKKPADSNDGKCDACGSCVCVRKVCVPKPKEREIKKVCWSYKCEDFCIPGPSRYCGTKCGKDECGCWSYEVWKPTCAEIRTKKVPVKTEVTRKVPGVEWKPEERCKACRCRKPEPGMLFAAQRDFHLDLTRTVFFGDDERDARAAENAGCLFSMVDQSRTLLDRVRELDWPRVREAARQEESLCQAAS